MIAAILDREQRPGRPQSAPEGASLRTYRKSFVLMHLMGVRRIQQSA